MKRLKEMIALESEQEISDEKLLAESLVGKGFAISQNRQHLALKNQVTSKLSQIQSDCRRGMQEDDEAARLKLLFEIFFDFAGALKIFADMTVRTNNIGTSSVLDQENVKQLLQTALSKLKVR